MLNVLATMLIAALSGSLIQLSAPARRMQRIKRLAEVRDALPEKSGEWEWAQRRIVAEARLLRRELHPWPRVERVGMTVSLVLLSALVAGGLIAATGVEDFSIFKLWLAMLVTAVMLSPLVTIIVLRHGRVSLWRRGLGPRWASSIGADLLDAWANTKSQELYEAFLLRRRKARLRRPPL